MNKLFLAITFIILFLNGALLSQTYNVRIEGHIIGYDGSSEIRYAFSDGNFERMDYTVKPDSTGRFTILKRINRTKFFWFWYSNEDEENIKYTCRLIVQPNCNYSIISEPEEFQDTRHRTPYSPDIYTWEDRFPDRDTYFSLDYGQMYYNMIDDGINGANHERWDLNNPEILIDKLMQDINSNIELFMDLRDQGYIDDEFYEIAKTNIELFNFSQLATTIQRSWIFPDIWGIADSTIEKKLIQVHRDIFDIFPIKDAKLEYFWQPERYIESYLYYYEAYKDGDFSPSLAGGSWLGYIEDIRPLIHEEVYKNYKGQITMSRLANLDLESLGPARRFLREFPDLQHTYYGELLESELIPRLEQFDSLARRDTPEGVIFLSDQAEINSFQQLIDSLDNKPFLISFWGSWCGPCRYQFQYSDILNNFLSEHGIEMVYIAREYRPNKENWKGMITAFELSGYHFISNEQFRSDLERMDINVRNFPTYMIVDSDGSIVETQAHFPSEEELLFEQLRDLLHLK